jgi:hypothetical protein
MKLSSSISYFLAPSATNRRQIRQGTPSVWRGAEPRNVGFAEVAPFSIAMQH